MARPRATFSPPDPSILPRAEEAEAAVLSGLMIENSFAPLILGMLQRQDFFAERNQLIFETIARLVDRGSPVDVLTVRDDLAQRGVLDLAGGISYVSNLDLDLPDISRLEDYAGIILEYSLRRGLIALGSRTIQRALDPGGEPVVGLVARAEADLRRLSAGAASGQLVTVGSSLRDTVVAVEDRHDRGGKDLFGLSTGLRDLDRLTQGFIGGEFILIAGRPGHGKTSLGLAIAEHAAVDLGLAAAVFSLEMSVDELNLRLLSRRGGIPFKQLRSGVLSQSQWQRVHEAEKLLASAPLYLSDDPRTTPAKFVAEVRRQHAETPLSVVVVDYLQLMVDETDKRRQMIESASRNFKVLARELQIPVVALSQLSRETERRSTGRPQLSDLREAGGLEQDADKVIFTHRGEEYSPEDPELKGVADLIVAKHRNGATGDVRCAWDGQTMSFRNLARGEAPF